VYPTDGGCAIGCVEAPSCDPPVTDCTAITTMAACDADSACYSVVQLDLCNCDGPGCCPPSFVSCQDGPALCEWNGPSPNCAVDDASCTVPYAVAYDSQGCPLGCVNEVQCGGL
jgi:hypothetical protein